jgi:hypothetical protein
VGSTSHLQNPLLQTIRALASTIKIHIINDITLKQNKKQKQKTLYTSLSNRTSCLIKH